MPTLQDVAKKAGVSTATVSKVLSNTPYFTESTRKKVMRAVEEVGYVPNLAARALSTGRTHIIAFVVPFVSESILADPNIVGILEGVEAECRKQGFNLLLSSPRSTDAIADSHYTQLLQSSYMDGVITFEPLPGAPTLHNIEQYNLPFVSITHHSTKHVVRPDDYSGGKQLFEHLFDLGHRNIGIISVPGDTHLGIRCRLKGIQDAAVDVGIDYDVLPVIDGDFSVQSGADAAAHLRANHPDLTAYIALNDRMAIGAIQQLNSMGLQVPDDISIVGYDDIPTASLFTPALTTINQQARIIGQAAAQMMFQILNSENPDTVSIPALLVSRQSSAAPSDSCNS